MVQTYLSSAIDDHSRYVIQSQFYDNQEEGIVEDTKAWHNCPPCAHKKRKIQRKNVIRRFFYPHLLWEQAFFLCFTNKDADKKV